MQVSRRRRLRDLTVGLSVLVAAVLAVVAYVWVNIEHMRATGRDDAEAREELAWADAVLDAAGDQDNALQALSSTGDRRYIAPYEVGSARFDGALAHLTAYAADDPLNQRQDVAEIARVAKSWELTVAQPRIAAVRSGAGPEAPRNGDGDIMIAIIRSRINDLRDGETRLLSRRDQAQEAAYGASRLALATGSAFALLLAVLILGRSARQLIEERRLAEVAADQLQAALERAHLAERTKSRFLANMSHEMRTPLSGVCGMAEALARTELEAPQRDLVAAVLLSSAALDGLIGDLLSLSSDNLHAQPTRQLASFRLGSAVRSAATPFAALAQAKGIGLSVEIGVGAEAVVVGDAPRLARALSCLLSNAVKFTDRGGVRMRVQKLGEARYRFEVVDTGIGFDATTQAQLFETFSQSDDSDTRHHGGAGLGLAVADRLVGEMGGSLDAQSTPGAGSAFRFELELATAKDGASAASPSNDIEPPRADLIRILIVDDNAMNRRVLELILDQVGAQWVSVADGRQAVEAVRGEAFAAILMDIQMPVMDGLAATREIRRLEREIARRPVPVIIVSASCQPEHLAAGRAAGAQRHLDKPVSAQVLVDTLNEVLAEAV